VHQLLAEDEMGQGAGEGGNGEEDHAAGYPPGAMTPSGEVGQQHGRAYLTHLTGTQQDTRGLRLDLEELLDGGDHGHKVGHVHALQDVGQQEDHHEDMCRGESPCPPGSAAKQATAGAGLRGGAAIEVGIEVGLLGLTGSRG